MKKHQQGFMLEALLVLSILGLVVGSIWFAVASSTNHRTETITINKSERIVSDGGQTSKYLIYTGQGVYEDTDNLINSKFNSSDLYNQLQAGKTYTCDVVGWRDDFQSWYPNLISCVEAKS